ncbi:Purine catabolism protein PucG (plasmid) [Variovorax sp. SRS16]|uniref:pyridoxal-phosphate-dependent aminotransferase family protein n=1 Tax=Variovorax sp. SRS16 TaxID=282217 RepID=UPI001316E8D5|nr:alanine--glyoxylate aminotransferase family protein [Variovorax sp. SRS16]VTU45880.1 Purine catabolism protein PucG [Variovorax sp. SRS16]
MHYYKEDDMSAVPSNEPAHAPRNPYDTPRKMLNMSTGPVEVSRRVLEAQLTPMLTPHHDDFWALHDETLGLLKMALRTRERVLLMHGSIRSGIDLALGNLIGPGTRMLMIQNGFWGTLVGQWAQLHGAVVQTLDHGPLEALELDRIRDKLRAERFDIVAVVHVETNSGIVNPIEAIGKLVAQTDALYFVDTACSAGAIPVETDRWHIDVQTTGSHKCLASIPGLAVLTVSDKAWGRMKSARMGAYFDFRRWWQSTVERSVTPPFTQPTTLVLALRQALLEITEGGMENWWARHAAVGTRFMDDMRAAGFRMLLDEASTPHPRHAFSDTVIAMTYPEGVADAAFRHTLLEDSGIFVIGNVGAYAGRSFRVGLMSPPQLDERNLQATMAAIQAATLSLAAAPRAPSPVHP